MITPDRGPMASPISAEELAELKRLRDVATTGAIESEKKWAERREYTVHLFHLAPKLIEAAEAQILLRGTLRALLSHDFCGCNTIACLACEKDERIRAEALETLEGLES